MIGTTIVGGATAGAFGASRGAANSEDKKQTLATAEYVSLAVTAGAALAATLLHVGYVSDAADAEDYRKCALEDGCATTKCSRAETSSGIAGETKQTDAPELRLVIGTSPSDEAAPTSAASASVAVQPPETSAPKPEGSTSPPLAPPGEKNPAPAPSGNEKSQPVTPPGTSHETPTSPPAPEGGKK